MITVHVYSRIISGSESSSLSQLHNGWPGVKDEVGVVIQWSTPV